MTNNNEDGCIRRAVRGREKLGKGWRIVWVSNENHAYVMPPGKKDRKALNLRAPVSSARPTIWKRFRDYTKHEILRLIASGNAMDITREATHSYGKKRGHK